MPSQIGVAHPLHLSDSSWTTPIQYGLLSLGMLRKMYVRQKKHALYASGATSYKTETIYRIFGLITE